MPRTRTPLSVTTTTRFAVESLPTRLMRLAFCWRKARQRIDGLNDGFNDGFRSLHNREMPDRVRQDHAFGQAPDLRIHRNAIATFSVQLAASREDDVFRQDRVARQSVTLDAHDATVDGDGYDGDHTLN
jgi:hypothetical protein